jgi:hypothetical protein
MVARTRWLSRWIRSLEIVSPIVWTLTKDVHSPDYCSLLTTYSRHMLCLQVVPLNVVILTHGTYVNCTMLTMVMVSTNIKRFKVWLSSQGERDGQVCSMHEIDEKCMQNFEEHFRELWVRVGIVSRWISKKYSGRFRSGFNWLGIRMVAASCDHWWKLGLHKMQGISWADKRLLVFQERLWSGVGLFDLVYFDKIK